MNEYNTLCRMNEYNTLCRISEYNTLCRLNEWIQHPVQAEWTPHYTLCSFCAVAVVASRADDYCQFRLVAGNPVRRKPLDELGRVLFGLYPPGFRVRSRYCCRSLHPLTSTGWWLCCRCSLAHWPIVCNVFSASIGGFSDGGGDVGNTHLSPSPPLPYALHEVGCRCLCWCCHRWYQHLALQGIGRRCTVCWWCRRWYHPKPSYKVLVVAECWWSWRWYHPHTSHPSLQGIGSRWMLVVLAIISPPPLQGTGRRCMLVVLAIVSPPPSTPTPSLIRCWSSLCDLLMVSAMVPPPPPPAKVLVVAASAGGAGDFIPPPTPPALLGVGCCLCWRLYRSCHALPLYRVGCW